MNYSYEEKCNGFFSPRYKKFGFDQRTLSWGSKESQEIRFVELLRICVLLKLEAPIKLLDMGCGLGHLYKFIKDRGFMDRWGIEYTGSDINQDLLSEAKSRMPQAEFLLKSEDVYRRNFDITVCSGVFNLKFSEDFDIHGYYLEELRKLFDISAKGVAVNFQSKEGLKMIPFWTAREEKKKFYFFDRDEVVNNLSKITPHVSVSEGYLPHDFTVYLLKDGAGL